MKQGNSKEIKVFRSLYAIIFCVFIVAIFHINHFDWDHFYTAFEVDIRSWRSFELPIWSYQFCGGVPRAADPQSFGFSPFMILGLLFGPQVSTKLILVICFILGFRYLTKYCKYCGAEIIFAEFISFSFCMSSFFIWHSTVGHLTFSLFFLVIGIFYFVFKSVKTKLVFLEKIELFILSFTVVISGFYPALIYFVLPLLFVFLFFIANMFFLKEISFDNIKSVFRDAIFPGILGFVFAVPRIAIALIEQTNFPRELDSKVEFNGISDLFIFFTIPVQKLAFLFDVGPKRPWPVWEYSHFSILNFIVFILLMLNLFNKKIKDIELAQRLIFLYLIILGLLLGMGDFFSFAPFSIINEYILSNSLRVSSRYLFLISFAMFIIAPFLINYKKIGKLYVVMIPICLLVILLQVLNQYNFVTMSETYDLMGLERRPVNGKVFISSGNIKMYRYVKSGAVFLNCYNPMNKKINLSISRSVFYKMKKEGVSFFDTNNIECQKNTVLTQNRILLPKNCQGKHGCFYLNRMNMSDDISSNIHFDKNKKQFCM